VSSVATAPPQATDPSAAARERRGPPCGTISRDRSASPLLAAEESQPPIALDPNAAYEGGVFLVWGNASRARVTSRCGAPRYARVGPAANRGARRTARCGEAEVGAPVAAARAREALAVGVRRASGGANIGRCVPDYTRVGLVLQIGSPGAQPRALRRRGARIAAPPRLTRGGSGEVRDNAAACKPRAALIAVRGANVTHPVSIRAEAHRQEALSCRESGAIGLRGATRKAYLRAGSAHLARVILA